jgi:hypothetical protein
MELSDALVKLCIDDFGPIPISIVAALVLLAIGFGAIRYLILSIFIPIYKQIDMLDKTGYRQRLKKLNIHASIESFIAAFIGGVALYVILPYPARMDLKLTEMQLMTSKAELEQTKANLEDSQIELETYRNQLEKSNQALHDINIKLQNPVKGQ